MDTFDRIEALLKEKGMTQADLSRATGISTGLISQWKKRMQNPSAEKLKLVADVFGVTVDSLMNGENEKIQTTENDELDKELEGVEFALWGEVHDLTIEEKKDIIKFAKFIKSKRGE